MTTVNPYERITVHVPHLEMRLFKAIMKAIVIEIEKKNAIDRALDDIEAGRITTYASADAMCKALGI